MQRHDDTGGVRLHRSTYSPVTPIIHAHSPWVSHGRAPGPNIVSTPVAKRVKDWSPWSSQSVSHLRIPLLCTAYRTSTSLYRTLIAGRIAIIVFPIVNSPGGQCLSIPILIPLTSWITCTSHRACIAVESKFHAHAVNFIGYRLHAVWKLVGIWNKVTRAVALLCWPAVVDIDVYIASIFKTKGNESFRGVDSCLSGRCVATSLILGRN